MFHCPTGLELSWEGDDFAGGFLIESSTEGGPYDIVGFVPSGTTSFVVKNLVPGREVNFRVSAAGTAVDTAASNLVSATPELGSQGAVVNRATKPLTLQ